MTRMRTFVGVALFAALVCGARAAAEVKVLAASGVVRVAPQGSEVYSAVVPGQVLAEGMMVVTGDDGRVTIAVGPGNTVRLRGNSRLAIKMVEARKSRFQLLAGKIRGVFNGMSGGKRFELEFAGGSAVASVKGTVFTAESGAQLATLNTIYGDIDVTINGQTTPVPQGCGLVLQLTAEGVVGKGGRIEVRILSDTEVSEGLNREGSDGGIRGERSELYIFVNNSGSENSKDREIVNQIREDDFSAGRTLKDIHGNIARVDQRLYRPDPSTMEFVNIVKRESYNYRTNKFSYNGYSGPRYDFMQLTAKFNMALPNSVLDWPDFVKANQDNIHPTQVVFSVANGGPNDTARDVIQKTVNFDANGDPVVVRTKEVVRTNTWYENIWSMNDQGEKVWNNTPHTNTWTETEKVEDETFLVNGNAYIVDGDAEKQDVNGEDSGELWGTAVLTAYRDTNGNKELDAVEKTAANRLLLRVEGYAMDSDGKVLNATRAVEEGGKNPLGYVQTIAGEAIVSPVNAQGQFLFGQGGLNSTPGSLAVKPSNIDMVVIPDIAVAIVNTYLPAIASSGLSMD